MVSGVSVTYGFKRAFQLSWHFTRPVDLLQGSVLKSVCVGEVRISRRVCTQRVTYCLSDDKIVDLKRLRRSKSLSNRRSLSVPSLRI